MAAGRALMPSTTMPTSFTACSGLSPLPMRMPARLLRLCMLVAVTIRSPMPARPAKVWMLQPMATPRRAISAMPRVIRAARALSP